MKKFAKGFFLISIILSMALAATSKPESNIMGVKMFVDDKVYLGIKTSDEVIENAILVQDEQAFRGERKGNTMANGGVYMPIIDGDVYKVKSIELFIILAIMILLVI